MQSRFLHIALLLLLAFLVSCTEHLSDVPVAGQSPSTYLWLYPDSTIATSVSRQHLHWWGEDPDGIVRGYLFAFAPVNDPVSTVPFPDPLRYTWVTKNDTLLLFPLDTLFKRFVVVVRAVDNRFAGFAGDTVRIIRLLPFPYYDRNDNGVFDSSDVKLSTLQEATDQKGAVLTFPIRNTPPQVSAVSNPLDPTQLFRQADTTYTVASFIWSGSDPDGNNTLRSYRIALNDTSNPANWVTLPLRDTMITLAVPRARSDAAGSTVTADLYAGKFLGGQYRGQISGLRLDGTNVFYVEAKDVAGEYSRPLVIPSGTDRWYVRRPRGTMLIVSDYANTDAVAVLSTYRTSLAAVPGGAYTNVDNLNITYGITLADKAAGKSGRLVPSLVDPALIYTFLLYDYVLWYTDQYPSLNIAQLTVFPYLQKGGRVIFSTSFLNTIDPRGALKDFAPIDSVSSVDLNPGYTLPSLGDTRIPANSIVFADSSDPTNVYPQLAFNSTPANHSSGMFMRPIYRRIDARYIYHLQPDSMTVYHLPDSAVARAPRNRYLGTPNLGVVDGPGKIIFMGVSLHLLNNTTYGNPLGLTAFFTKAFTHFSPSQRVQRRRY
jgi:hypothetical protein